MCIRDSMSLDWLLGPQLQAFADAGYRVIGMSAPGPHVDHLREQGLEHVALSGFTRSRRALDDVRAFWQLVAALRRVRPDIVHTHNPKPGVLGRCLLYTSDAADERSSVDLGGRRIIKKKRPTLTLAHTRHSYIP